MPPSRTKAPKADAVTQDAFYCDSPGCGISVSRLHDLPRHKLIHSAALFKCKQGNKDGSATLCKHEDRQLSNLKNHLKCIHGVDTTVKELRRIYLEPGSSPVPLSPRPTKKTTTVPQKWVLVARKTHRSADVDDAPPAYTAGPSPSQSSTLSAQTATFSGWVVPTPRAPAPASAVALPATLAYAVQSTTYAGWVSADYSQSIAPLTQGSRGVFKVQIKESIVHTKEEEVAPAPFYGWAGRQQAPQSAVTTPAVSLPSNSFPTAPASQPNWTVSAQATTEPMASFAYAQQQQFQHQMVTQLPLNPSPTYVDSPPVVSAHADDLLPQWTWTDGYTLVPSCPAPTDASKVEYASSASPSSSSVSSSTSSSPSSSSSSSWAPLTSPTALAHPDPATVKGQEQEYARFSGTTAAPPAFTRDFDFTQAGLTQPKALAVAALAEFADSPLPTSAVESQPKSEAQLQLESEAQAMADFEALFGTEVTPTKIESDYFNFDLASSDLDAEALNYWSAWGPGQC